MLPFGYTRWAFTRFEHEDTPLVFYLHPWEIDHEQPRIAAPFKSRLRHYTNLGRTQARLEHMLQLFKFQTFREYLQAHNDRPAFAQDAARTALQPSAG
jgi:hypothetical protein